jgi:membrane protease subunit HflC
MRRLLLGLLVVAGVAVFVRFCIVILDERQQGFRTILNNPDFQLLGFQINQPLLTEPGVYVRIPGLHQVYRYDRRKLRYDAKPRELYTTEKVLIVVDYFAIWQIEDPRLFFESVRTYPDALRRLDTITYSELRKNLALHSLKDLLSEARSSITRAVAEQCDQTLSPLGIRIRDLRIRRSDYPKANLDQIFMRMQKERERFAKKFRAEGGEAALEIRSLADRESRIIRAEAMRQSETLRGQGEAQATQTYAEAFDQDRDFYAFMKSLETYRKAFGESTRLVLTPRSHFLRYLFPDGKGPTPGSVGSGKPREQEKAP